MNNLVSISNGATNARQTSMRTGSKSLSSGSGTSGFASNLLEILNQISSESSSTATTGIKTASAALTTGTSTKVSNGLTSIAAKIANILKASGKLPSAMENLSDKELTQQIAQALNDQGITQDNINTMSTDNLTTALNSAIKSLSNMDDASAQDIIDSGTTTTIAQTLQASAQKTVTKTSKNEDLSKLTVSQLVDKIKEMPEGDAKDKLVKTLVAKISNSSKTAKDALDELQDNADSTGTTVTNNQLLGVIQQQLALIQSDSVTDVDTTKAASITSEIKNDIISSIQTQQTTDSTDKSADTSLAAQLKEDTKNSIAEKAKSNIADSSKDIQTALKLSDSESKETVSNKVSNANDSRNLAAAAAAAETNANNALKADSKSSNTTTNNDISAKVSGISLSSDAIASLQNYSDGGSDKGSDSMNGGDNWSSLYGTIGSASSNSTSSTGFTNYLSSASTTTGYSTSPTTQMVALQLQYSANNNVNTMKLQLMPEELGKLDISLQFKNDGTVTAKLTAEKQETLDLLKKDSNYLEKALQQAGFSTNENSLSFNLNQQGNQNFSGFNGQNQNSRDDFQAYMNNNNNDNDVDMLQVQIAVASMGYINSTGVNIQV